MIRDYISRFWSGKLGQTKSDIIQDKNASGDFEIGKTYVAVDLQGMNLMEDYKFLSKFSPFVALLFQFGPDEESDQIPVLYNPSEVLAAIGGGANVLRPDVRGIPLVPPRPLQNDVLQISGGLFQKTKSDSGKLLLDTLSEISKAGLGIPGAAHIETVGIAYAGIKKLMGIDSLSGRATIARGFKASGSDKDFNAMNPGWLLIQGRNAYKLSDLELENGVLKSRADGADFEKSDWLLLRLRAEKRRGTYSDLPFEEIWKKYKRHLWKSELPAAKQAYLELNSEIVSCDLLIEEEKDTLLQEYFSRKIREENRLKLTEDPSGEIELADDPASGTRSSVRRGADAAKLALSEKSAIKSVALQVRDATGLLSSDMRTELSGALDRLAASTAEEAAVSTDVEIDAAYLDGLRSRLGPAVDPVKTSFAYSKLSLL